MGEHSVSLAGVEEFIGAEHKGLRFPAWLEAQFEADTQPRRSQRLRAATVRNVVIYNLFLIADWFLLPDQFQLAAFLHAFVVTPWIVLVGWFAGNCRGRFAREAAAGSIPVIIVLQILCTFTRTNSVDVAHYQYFVLLVLLFTNTVQRLPFPYAVTVSATIVVLQGAAIGVSGQMSGAAAVVAVVTVAVAAYLTLAGNYYLERDARRSYLHGLRDRLRHAEADAIAKRDGLTELGNRRLLQSRIDEVWGSAAAPHASVAIIMLDIDHFKMFNDRYGHVAGDLCLKRVAACVRSGLSNEGDTAIRYGGEEILALLPGSDMCAAVRIAERIRRTVEDFAIPHEGLGPRNVVTVSLGVAVAPVSAISAAELVSAADAALYAAKRNGRNQVWPPLLRDGGECGDEATSAVISLACR